VPQPEQSDAHGDCNRDFGHGCGAQLPGGFEQEIIGNLLVGPEQSPQLSRYCEVDYKIVNLQQFGLLSFKPSLTFVVLATGAAAMVAGMEEKGLVVAITAFQHHYSALLIPAAAEGMERLIMSRQKSTPVFVEQIRQVAIDDLSAARVGKEKAWVSMGSLEAAQMLECWIRKWNIAIFPSFTLAHMDTPLVGINVSNLHTKAFSKPKTHAVDHKEKRRGSEADRRH
jgi:hypothetical protein